MKLRDSDMHSESFPWINISWHEFIHTGNESESKICVVTSETNVLNDFLVAAVIHDSNDPVLSTIRAISQREVHRQMRPIPARNHDGDY